MSINTTTSSSSVSSSATASAVTQSAGADNTKKSSTESSFKDEMDKVSTQEQASSEKNSEMAESKEAFDAQSESNKNEAEISDNIVLEAGADYSEFASISVIDVNNLLTNDIRQMIDIASTQEADNQFYTKSTLTLDFSQSLSMNESDANFFLGLTKNNDISMANITAQAQSMLNNGAEIAEVRQNVQISQTLLNAINNARENNQPLRIDFDQNISVILRINKEGVISANFIPGDKAVEQYLRNNISSLRATFEENDLPYSDLSYSNRGSKQQKENRRNNNK